MIYSTTGDPRAARRAVPDAALRHRPRHSSRCVVCLRVDYRTLADRSHLIYAVAARCCSSTCCSSASCAAAAGAGSRCRSFNLQPSEFAKIGARARPGAVLRREPAPAPRRAATWPSAARSRRCRSCSSRGSRTSAPPSRWCPCCSAMAFVAGMRLQGGRHPAGRWRSSPRRWRGAYALQGLPEGPHPDVPRPVAGSARRRLPADPGADHRRVGRPLGQGVHEGHAGAAAASCRSPTTTSSSPCWPRSRGSSACSPSLGLYLFVMLRALETARLAQGPARARYLVVGVAGELHVPGDLQRHDVGGAGPGQGAHAAAHELRRVVDDRHAGRLRADPQREDAEVHELTACRTATDAGRAFTEGGRRGVRMNKEMIISSNGHQTMVAILEDDQVGRGLRRARAPARRRRQHLQGPRVEGAARHAVGVRRHRPRARRLPLRLRRRRHDRRVRAHGRRRRGRRGGRRRRRRPTPAAGGRKGDRAPKIETLLKEGQEILVQVVKEPLGTKGARLTSHVTMAGRFLVFMPTVDHVGVSRKIESREERARLRGIVREFREAHGFTGGVIIRTAAADRPEEDIVGDLVYFQQDLGRDPPEGRVVAAPRPSSTASRAWWPSSFATCSPTSTRPSGSTTRRSTGACRSWSSASCPRWRRA